MLSGLLLALAASSPIAPGAPAAEDPPAVRALVETLKRDPRGPYQAIRWFCPDGSVLPARERCAQPGGRQHGLVKDEVAALQRQGLFLGQILAGTDFEEFWGDAGPASRLKQYQLEHFLRAIDDGWIMRRGRYYRGAVQAEDEEAWSERFLAWLVSRDEALRTRFYLVRRAAADLPRAGRRGLSDRIRAAARSIAVAVPDFADLRVKIHGSPDVTDAVRVAEFRRQRAGRLPPGVGAELAALESDLRALFASATASRLEGHLERFPPPHPVGARLARIAGPDARLPLEERCEALAELLLAVRRALLDAPAGDRLALLDASLDAGEVLAAEISRWQPRTPRELLRRSHALARAAAGSGMLELWEWEAVEPELLPPVAGAGLTVAGLLEEARAAQRAVAWGSDMVRATYQPLADRWAAFEPLARGFVDDRIRSSLLLAQGAAAAELSTYAARRSGVANRLLDLEGADRVRGLNPGLARGRLEVIQGPAEGHDLKPDRIYALLRPPSEMEPVAGILSVSAGNAVSHVQLLARNLGIPNAVLTADDLPALAAHAGTEVFYAVSPKGAVLLKPAAEMTAEERALVDAGGGAPERLTAPVDELDLEVREILDMRSLGAADSGRVCGPKAANLGVLSGLFPGSVPPGLVIPFGTYREHLGQPIPGGGESYWDAVEAVFAGDPAELSAGLAELRRAIAAIPFLPGFEASLAARFRDWLGAPLGELPVFVRSDTNMEDLEGFTGAGLNLTVANVRSEAEVLQAIRDVWASPFGERAFEWRRRVLRNPEAVYPSIAILPSVEVDRSGVLITTGVQTGEPGDLTVAFNRGGTGAVAGQSAETWALRSGAPDLLLSPAREPTFTRISPGGGLERVTTSFERPILDGADRAALRRIGARLGEALPGTPGLSRGPYDAELGFRDVRLWLFQVRPFVERRAGREAAYLQGLDATVSGHESVALDEPLL